MLFLLLFLLWLILNGRFALDVVVSGVLVSGAVCAFAWRFCKWDETRSWRWGLLLPRFGAYLALLVKEIFMANLQVMALILKPGMKEEIQPQMVSFSLPLKSAMAKVLLANSITLTPGTITVELSREHYVIHALTPAMGEGLENSAFAKAALALDEAFGGEEREEEADVS